jgi:hypothetical protein
MALCKRRLAGFRQLCAVLDHALVTGLRIPDYGAAKLSGVGSAGGANRRSGCGTRRHGEGGRH